MEDIKLCEAFVTASKDANVGIGQRSADFKAKMFEIYCKLINEMNESFATNYHHRQSPHSNLLRFKEGVQVCSKVDWNIRGIWQFTIG